MHELYQLFATSRVSPSTIRAGPRSTSPAQAGCITRADRSRDSAVDHPACLTDFNMHSQSLHAHASGIQQSCDTPVHFLIKEIQAQNLD